MRLRLSEIAGDRWAADPLLPQTPRERVAADLNSSLLPWELFCFTTACVSTGSGPDMALLPPVSACLGSSCHCCSISLQAWWFGDLSKERN